MPTPVDGFRARVDQILWPVFRNGQVVNRTLNTVSEGKLYQKELTNVQAQLRSAKKDVNLHMKTIRLNFGAASSNVSSHPIVGLIAGKKKASHVSAIERQNLKARQHNTLLPYEGLNDYIDRMVQYLDGLKLAVDKAIQDGRIS